MTARPGPIRTAILLLWATIPLVCAAQSTVDIPVESGLPSYSVEAGREVPVVEDKPLPDIPSLMHDVESNQRAAEAIQKNYLYHSVETQKETDGGGRVKKTVVTESDHYWVNGVPIRRVVRKDGKDLAGDELAKENDRVDKQAAKGRARRDKGDAEGKETDAGGHDEITVSRFLELGSFTNPRRVLLSGRPTIAVDYTGDPKAKTRNRAEDVIRDMAGTAWVDEQDHVLSRAEGHFVRAFKIGAGLVANIQKDTRFSMQQTKVNGEVWLPAHIEAQGSARALLFFSFNGSIEIAASNYRKFRATSTIVPAATTTSGDPTGDSEP